VLRTVARLSFVAVILGAGVVLTASPCAACSCAPQTPERLFRHADAAFIGAVIDQQAIDPTRTVQTFRVRSVFKGSLGPTVQVIDPIGSGGGDTCGILYGPGEVAVILHEQGAAWTTDACSRITIAQLTRVAPSPAPPSPERSPAPTATITVAPSGESSSGLGWQAVVLGLLVGIAGIALVLSFGGRGDRRSAKAFPEAADAPEDAPRDPPGPSG